MTLDATARKAAFGLLSRFGKSATYKSIVQGLYDPETGGAETSVVAYYPVVLYLDNPNAQELASGQVVQSDEVALFAALGLQVEPSLNDRIEIDGKDRLVKMVSRVWSGAQIALWRVGLAS